VCFVYLTTNSDYFLILHFLNAIYKQRFIPLNPVVNNMYHQCNIQQFYIVPKECKCFVWI